MQKILESLASRVAEILEKNLPTAGEDWWRTAVIDRLSIQQQRLVVDRRVTSLSGLDLAALLRVFDQNWHDLGYRLNLDSQTRNWLKEAQSIRNRWAHLPSGGMRPDDAYRDVDTIYRLLGSLGAEQTTLDQIQNERERMLLKLAPQAKAGGGHLRLPHRLLGKFIKERSFV